MKRVIVFLLILAMILGCSYFAYTRYFGAEKIPRIVYEEKVINVDELYIYGPHLNFSGNIDLTGKSDLILYNGGTVSYSFDIKNNKFNFAEYFNEGLFLEDIPIGDFYLFIREEYTIDNEIKYRYYRLNNISEYDNTEYYTFSNTNRKIKIDKEDSYPTMMIHVSDNTDNPDVYDIVLDPGHGGMDGGASKNGYKETDFTLDIAKKVKEKLELNGIKVKLTHEGIDKNEKLDEYGHGGRAVVPHEVNAKYLFSFHLNSSNYSSVHGLEIYTSDNINYNFANLLVKNITTYANTSVSGNRINKVYDGIYTRTFTEDDISNSMKDYADRKLNPYNITTKSNYYYIIRETGGIVTGAYVDDRNGSIKGNPYVKSNVGSEAYLLELGYISNINDLNNIKNNMDKYVDGIVDSIMTLFNIEENH